MEQFGPFQLLEQIGEGGMARVYRARALDAHGLSRTLVIKRLHPALWAQQRSRDMFVNEAKITLTLRHPNIVHVFGFGEESGHLYLALEYVPGIDVRQILLSKMVRGTGIPAAQALLVAKETCAALQYAHSRTDAHGRLLHLIHRDVSPHNILLAWDGSVKLVDFGIAKAAGSAALTRPKELKGKFPYLSPEQICRLKLDQRADIFGLGVTLHEMLTGRPLFSGEDSAILHKILSGHYVPPSHINPHVPEELDQLVMRAIHPDRQMRYQTALEFAEAIEAAADAIAVRLVRDDLSIFLHALRQAAPTPAANPRSAKTQVASAVPTAQSHEATRVETTPIQLWTERTQVEETPAYGTPNLAELECNANPAP